MKRRRDLIVPIRDRRQRKRIVTLKNFRNLVVVIVVFFAGVTIESDLRHPPSGDYGRLLGKQISRQTDVPPAAPKVVREGPVVDATAADPLLIAPAAREQYLGVNASSQPVVSGGGMTVSSGVMTVQPLDAPRGSGPAIVGGPEGVSIVRGGVPQRPALSGGIFRQ